MQSWRTTLSIVFFSLVLAFLALQANAQDDSPSNKPPAEKSLPDLIDAVEPSVVIISTDRSMGSGFLVSNNGIIVTNYHVIEGALTAKVIFADKKEYDVQGVLKMDAGRDVAILKINSRKTKILKFSSNLPRKGEKVYTFGTPLGRYEFSTSEGIVSGIRTKNDTSEFDYEGTWIQTTAPISSGNGGGPLVNLLGEVVGMNTLASNEGQNINFAICSADIERVLSEAKKVKEPTKLSDIEPDATDIGEKIETQQLTDAVLKQYFDAGAAVAKGAVAICKEKTIEYGNMLKLVRTGVISPSRKYDDSTGVELGLIGDGVGYHFRDQQIKSALIIVLTEEISKYKTLLDDLQNPVTGPLTAAVFFGPQLTFTDVGNMGRVDQLKVERVVSKSAFIAVLSKDKEKTRVVVAGIPTDGLMDGQTIEDEVFMFVGIAPYTPRGGYERRLAVLQHLPSEMLVAAYKRLYPGGASANRARPGDPNSPPVNKPGPSRQWKGKDGKFSITAKFVRVESSRVVLQPDSGLAVRYAIDQLSAEDQKWILDHLSK